MIAQLQTNNSTFYGRYWTETTLLRRYAPTDENLSVLSFGCSTGEELLLLRRLFPAAKLFGCDYDWSGLLAARALLGRDAVLFDSGQASLDSHGPFDIIVCNSVLLNGSPSGIPCALWDDAVASLDAALKPGGILQIINSNIPFRLHPVAKNYSPLRSPLILGPHFVDQFDREGRLLCRGVAGSGITAMLNSHVAGEHWRQLVPQDLTDVHFQKPGGKPAPQILDQRLPNLAQRPPRASGQITFRPHAPDGAGPVSQTEIDIAWSSLGVDAVRVDRTARRTWFDGLTLPEERTVIEMQGPIASAFLESVVGRPSMRVMLGALENPRLTDSPAF